MGTFTTKSASAAAPISASRQCGRCGRGPWFGRGVLTLTLGAVLAGCSANSTAEAEPANTPAAESPSPSVAVPEVELAEPLAPQIERDGVSPSGTKVISEQGTGTGTHEVHGVLEAGQVLSLSASCTPGDYVTLSQGTGDYIVPCSNPASSYSFNAPANEAVENVEVTVSTANGSPYWLAAWVHDAQQ